MEFMKMQREESNRQLEMAKLQLETYREESKREREESRRRDERHQEEMKLLRKEMDDRKASNSGDLLTFVREQGNESIKRSESTIKALQEISKTQIDMVQLNSKNQMEMMISENKRLADELRDTRLNNKTDLTSEVKKLVGLRDLLGELKGDTEPVEPSLSDKLAENLPMIFEHAPDIISSIGDLFRKGVKTERLRTPPGYQQPRALQGPQPQALPQRMIRRQAAEQAADQAQPQPPPQARPAQLTQEQAAAAEQIALIKSILEIAIEKGEDPEACYNANLAGKFDPSLLARVAQVSPAVILSIMKQNFGEDGPIFTVRGKQFVAAIHAVIRKYNT